MKYKVVEIPFTSIAQLAVEVNKEATKGGTWKIVFVESNPSYYRVWFEQAHP